QKTACCKLPCAKRREVKDLVLVPLNKEHRKTKRYDQDEQYGALQAVSPIPPHNGEEQWQHQIEMLFDSQRPRVQERVQLQLGVDVPADAPEIEIGDECRRCYSCFARAQIGGRRQHPPADQKHESEY